MKIEKRKADSEREVRTLRTPTGFEVRAADDGNVKVSGYAAIFDEEADLGYFREVIRKGAFKDVISRGDDVRFLINHDGLPLARTASGTLTLKEDKRGLWMEATLKASDPDVMRITPKMERGDLNQMSFAFTIFPNGEVTWTDRAEGDEIVSVREVKKVGQVYDVAIVTFPAYAGTEIALRSREEARKAKAPGNATAAGLLRRKLSLDLKGRRIG